MAEQTPGAGRRERRDAQQNQERVLDAARELFAERGLDVHIKEVAERAGVGVGTIYRSYLSKEQLYAAASQAACHHAEACLRQAAAQAATPAERLRSIVTAHYRESARQAALLDLQPAAPAHDEGGLFQALQELIGAAIAEGQRLGQFRPGDPQALAAICLALLSPHAIQQARHAAAGCPEGAAGHVADFILAGLRRQ